MVEPSPAKEEKETPVKSKEAEQSPDVKQFLESLFLDYLRAVRSASAEAQKRGTDIYQAYLREIGEEYAELVKRVEDLQRDYVAGIQEAVGHEDAVERAEQAYNDATAAYLRLMREAQHQGEHINKKLISLLNQQGEDLQKQYADAFTSYISGLRGATQQLDALKVILPDLEYLSKSVATVALYASATGALPASESLAS